MNDHGPDCECNDCILDEIAAEYDDCDTSEETEWEEENLGSNEC